MPPRPPPTGRRRCVFEKERPALVILDLMLPDISGEEVCRRLRARSRVPIIMLTAKSDDMDAVRGLELGADDYVTKPFSPRQLMARVEAVLRRSADVGSPSARVLAFNEDDLVIDDAAGTVRKSGSEVSITPREYRILRLLAGNPGLGRPCDEVRPGLRRMEQGKHVAFYREEPGGIRIARILHQRMLPENQAIDDDEEAAGSP